MSSQVISSGTHTLCEHDCQFLRNLFIGHLCHFLFIQINSTADRGKLSGDAFKNSGFSGTVRTDESEDFSLFQLNIDFSDKRFSVISHSQLIRTGKNTVPAGLLCYFLFPLLHLLFSLTYFFLFSFFMLHLIVICPDSVFCSCFLYQFLFCLRIMI